ncbi:MAG: hypothetical protein JSR45_15745 [Proteobacteria bacterium]|nr:hypothetical protein [Pseudomonadota bacterium]
MKPACALTALFCLAALPAAAAPADPLGPAHAGKVQCFQPNMIRKTCHSIGAYSFEGGRIANRAQILIPAQIPLVMTLTSPVTIRGQAVCGAIRAQDFTTATFTANDQAVTEDSTKRLREALASAMAAMVGKEVCTTLTGSGENLRAEATIDGAPKPELGQDVMWVAPADGYRVAP